MKTTSYLKTIIVCILCILVTSCSKDDAVPQPQPITKIDLNKTEVTLTVESTDQLSVTTDINGKSITWTSANPEIASVNENGIVTAVSEGTATITAKVDNAEATCTVTVTLAPITEIALDKTELTLTAESTDQLTVTTEINGKPITWTSSNTAVVSVDENGKLTAVSEGVATVTAKVDNAEATCSVTVTPAPITEITLNKTELTLSLAGDTASDQLSVTTDINGKPITWTSSDPGIASVNSQGKVTAISMGTVTITAQVEEAQATCTVTVTPDLYVIGSLNGQGTVWKNSEVIKENLRSAEDIFVTPSGIYILGENKVFLNDAVRRNFSDNDRTVTALYVDANQNADYVCGFESATGGKIISKMWKNGTETILSDTGLSKAYDIFVHNNDVYVLGNFKEGRFGIPDIVLWKNGVEEQVIKSNGFQIEAKALFVDNAGNVYIGGHYKGIPTIWKNGVETQLDQERGGVNAIFVKDGDVYATGYANDRSSGNAVLKAVFWKNEVKTNLTDGTQERERGNDIVAFNNDVYVAVTKYNNTTNQSTLSLYRNGHETILGNGNNTIDAGIAANKLFVYSPR